MAYENLVFPQTVGGPGPWDTVELTVTANGDPTATNPVLAQTDLVAFNAASDADKARHRRFSDIVMFFQRYGEPIKVESDGDTKITLYYERRGMFADSAAGKAPFFYSSGNRPNAYDMATSYIASDDHGVTAMTVKVNGVTQNS